jgi:hypothetical protein
MITHGYACIDSFHGLLIQNVYYKDYGGPPCSKAACLSVSLAASVQGGPQVTTKTGVQAVHMWQHMTMLDMCASEKSAGRQQPPQQVHENTIALPCMAGQDHKTRVCQAVPHINLQGADL